MSNENRANQIYKIILEEVVIPLTGNVTTVSTDLYKIARKFLGKSFSGVYPADKIPVLNKNVKYAILNLDPSYMSGSHWVAIAKKGDTTYLYDSFGRSHSKIIKTLGKSGNGRIVNTDLDVEQSILETNCGARSLGWLLLFDRFGSDTAILI